MRISEHKKQLFREPFDVAPRHLARHDCLVALSQVSVLEGEALLQCITAISE